jgi:hypothetical protein
MLSDSARQVLRHSDVYSAVASVGDGVHSQRLLMVFRAVRLSPFFAG